MMLIDMLLEGTSDHYHKNMKMEHYNQKEIDLIKSHSNEIVRRLSILLRDINEFKGARARFMIMKGRMTDIFDDYRRLHAVVFKYEEVSNEKLIRCFNWYGKNE